MNHEIDQWIEKNIEGSWISCPFWTEYAQQLRKKYGKFNNGLIINIYNTHRKYFFEREEDAVLFRLTWL